MTTKRGEKQPKTGRTDAKKGEKMVQKAKKVTINYFSRGEFKEKSIDILDIYAIIHKGRYAKRVAELRSDYLALLTNHDSTMMPENQIEGIHTLPEVRLPAGMVLLPVPTSSIQQLEQLRKRVALFPQTMMAFQSVGGNRLLVVMCFERTDGTLPSEDREVALFQQYAYRRAADFLLASTGMKAEEADEVVNQTFFVSSDANAIWNAQLTPIRMEQPMEELTEKTATIIQEAASEPMVQDVLPGYSQLEMDILKFNAICRKLSFKRKRPIDEYLLTVAHACHQAGIDQEVATKCLLNVGDYWEKEVLIRSTMDNAYQKHRMGMVNPIDSSLMYQQLMKDFLKRRYLFRRNVVTGDVEYQEKGRYITSWRPLTEEARNDINNAAIDEGIKVWPKDMDRYIGSSRVDDYDPVRQWMNSLPEWDGRDRLGEMADRVPTKLNDWRNHFKVWMRAMVSQWTSGAGRMYGAQMVMMFVGAQGTRKSTFMRMILPPELQPFYIDRIDFSNKKEALRALSRFLLINIDEYDQVSKAQTAYLKHLIQRTDVKERKMYETTYQQMQRYAAFCATTNSLSPLKDETGSRRYMVVEVTDVIDTNMQGEHAIDYPQLYAQIKEEIRRGEETYFDGERERMIIENGTEYYELPNVISIFCDKFKKPADDDEILTLTPTEILVYIRDTWRIDLVNQSNAVFLGNYLRREGFEKGSGEKRRKYLISRVLEE